MSYDGKQGRIQPVRLGGVISVIFGSETSSRFHYFKGCEVCFAALLCMDDGTCLKVE